MKKFEKYIYIVIALIFVAVLASGVTYIVMDKQNDKTEIKDNEPSNKENENEKSEQITLSESELEEYLNYVPYRTKVGENDNSFNFNAYLTNLSISQLGNKELIENALKIALEENNYDEIYGEITENDNSFEYLITIPKKDIERILLKGYNISAPNFVESENLEEYYQIECASYIYKNNKFYGVFRCGDGLQKIGIINNYELENDNLIIYEYAAQFDDLSYELLNFKNNKTIKVDYLNIDDYQNVDKYLKAVNNHVKNIVKENKEEFSLYKHTFKKNDTGYYWYKTEVVK